MTPTRPEQEAALARADAALAQDPRSLPQRFARAHALDTLGRDEEARQAYLSVLELDPAHLDGLLGLARLCLKLRYTLAAKTALRQAVAVRPDSSLAHSNLATVLGDEGELAAAREHYEKALQLDPKNQSAHQGLAIVLLRLGELAAAKEHGRIGFGGGAEKWAFRGAGRPVSLLITYSAIGGNVPINQYIDDRVFQKWTLVPEFFDPEAPLPPHDLAFNGIGDADRCGAALEAAARLLARSTSPVLNAPARVLATSRAANAERLRQVPGVQTAHTVEWARQELAAPDALGKLDRAGFRWPLLLRAPGFNNGFHFEKLERPGELRAAVEALPGERLLTLQYLDTRSPDGKYRKFRVMMVGGRLYPLHLAISERWKVHYLSADMADNAEHRAEDAAFLRDMPGFLGPAVVATLERVRDRLGLDYCGVDFALGAAPGSVVLFEANATMVILPPDASNDRFAYRAAPVERVRRAVDEMLLTRAWRPV